MEKLAHPPTPLSLYLSTITYKVVVYAPAERADTLPPYLIYPYIYSVGYTGGGYARENL
jgi:hypothetical protein